MRTPEKSHKQILFQCLGFTSLFAVALVLSSFATLGCGNDETGSPQDMVSTVQQKMTIKNERSVPIHMTCTKGDANNHCWTAQSPCDLTWGQGCTSTGSGALGSYTTIAANSECELLVDSSTGCSRLCASENAADIPDCWKAQWNKVTLMETNFTRSEVFYDISIIPLNWADPMPPGCDDNQYSKDYCHSSGPASYNLPVSLKCGSEPGFFTCKGPAQSWATSDNYPANCGNPPQTEAATRVCGKHTPCNVTAFFYPMAGYAEGTNTPVRACGIQSTFIATILDGQ